jgi:AcrR family transcriptional regulator
MTTSPIRRPRADARRNREAILRAARAKFAAEGIFAPIDGIAAAAGLGNATLYRNFPTRDDLLAAVMEDSVLELMARSRDLEEGLAAEPALREWLFQLAWGLRLWHDLPSCIATAYDDATSPVQGVVAQLTERTNDFLVRHASDGGVVANITVEDVFQLVTAVSWAIDRFGDDEQRARDRLTLATAAVF